MIATDYTKCLSCRWRDVNNVQCFDGHLQMPNKKECEGYEYSDIPEKIKFDAHEIMAFISEVQERKK